ncbi:MAG TPA: MlaD family protein [Burkholderiaceae bacterium]|nr:MlaD family protein [Burkholderiaceae bacterium]
MEPEARYTVVGAIVLALVAAVSVAYVWLAHGGGAASYRFYEIHFENQTLDGLQLGSEVNMRGVKVGRVQEYSISRDNINRVEVVIRVDRQTPVSRNTSAVISRNLVTGLARVDLVTPGTPGPPLVAVAVGDRYPRIPEGTSNLEQIAGALSRLAVTGESALSSVERLLSAENRETLVGAVAAVRDLAAGLDQRLDRIDGAADSFRSTALAMQRSSNDVAASIRELAKQGTASLRDIEPLGRQAQAALGDLSAAAKALERESATIARRLESTVDTGALELRATARELRQGAEQLSRAAERLRDPRAALLGPSPAQLGPGEKLP